MGSFVRLGAERLSVEPGSSARLEVTVRNTGSLVDQFAIDVVGEAAAFAVVEPPTLSLFPGKEEKAVVRFSPPRAPETPAGELRFGVRVVPREDREGSSVEEATLVVGAFTALTAELAPRMSSGRRSAIHTLSIGNGGNVGLDASIDARDQDGALRFEVSPQSPAVSSGAERGVRLRVSPTSPFWRGAERARPFKVTVAANSETRDFDGVFVQKPMVPGLVGTMLAAAPGFVLAAAAVSALVIQPWKSNATPTPPASVISQVTPTPTPLVTQPPTAPPTDPPTPTPTPTQTPTQTPTITAPPTPTPLVALGAGYGRIATGYKHSCAIRSDGAVLCWGANTNDQLNIPTGTFVSIAASPYANTTCGVRADGTIACWGWNAYGALNTPEGQWAGAVAGFSHACAIRPNGSVKCWGTNFQNESDVLPGTYLTVGAGVQQTCALREDRTIACWGRTYGSIAVPTGQFSVLGVGYTHSCAIAPRGAVSCWGLNDQGQAAAPKESYSDIAPGVNFTCGVRATGTIGCWGAPGTYKVTTPPAGSFVQVAAGGSHACAIKTDGAIACWGDNTAGQATPPKGRFLP